MSLVQRVTSIEGTDRGLPEFEPFFTQPPPFIGYGTLSPGRPSPTLRHQASRRRSSVRHVLSYDALAKPEEPSKATDPYGGVTAYKISTARRIGECYFINERMSCL